ncbi:MAG: hypothetical protein R3C18_20085 [Planctomycetaceae bacterium]
MGKKKATGSQKGLLKGTILEINRTLKYGLIQPIHSDSAIKKKKAKKKGLKESVPKLVLFQKRALRSLSWDCLWKDDEVSYMVSDKPPGEGLQCATLVTSGNSDLADRVRKAYESTSKLSLGKVVEIHEAGRFGVIVPTDDHEQPLDPRTFVTFSEKDDKGGWIVQPRDEDENDKDAFSNLAVGDTVEFQEFLASPETGDRAAWKVRRREIPSPTLESFAAAGPCVGKVSSTSTETSPNGRVRRFGYISPSTGQLSFCSAEGDCADHPGTLEFRNPIDENGNEVFSKGDDVSYTRDAVERCIAIDVKKL